MNTVIHATVIVIAISIFNLKCGALVSKVSSEDIMVAAFGIKKASEAADKLASAETFAADLPEKGERNCPMR
jgi:hypothetical protein